VSIFDWIKDIEKQYDNLINNAKTINLKNIEEFRTQQQEQLDKFLDDKNQLVNNALMTLTTSSNVQIKIFEEKMDKAFNKIEEEFQLEIPKLLNLIFNEMGLDF